MIPSLLAATLLLVQQPSLVAARPDATHLVTISVAGDRTQTQTLAHTISVAADTARTAGSDMDLARWGWRATRTSEKGEQTIGSQDCPALRQAALAFGGLPPLPVASPVLRVQVGSLPIEPTIKDGYSTRLTFRTLTDDGSEAIVELSGGVAYAEWANHTVDVLTGCWGPLRP